MSLYNREVGYKMYNIDEIMKMLDHNKDIEMQQREIEIWENCAKILIKATDRELILYLEKLLECIKDINWPGASMIMERLKGFSEVNYTFKSSFIKCVTIANETNNEKWLSNLAELIENKRIRYKLSNDILEILMKYKSIDIIDKIDTDNIDEIIELLDWNNDVEIQQKGIELAKNIKDITVFIKPKHHNYSKMVWENCAIILRDKTDEELTPYLENLLEWIKDINWPGALIIMERLKQFLDTQKIADAINSCFNKAIKDNNNIWIHSLAELLENKKIKDMILKEVLERLEKGI